jgi:hypothetical protein
MHRPHPLRAGSRRLGRNTGGRRGAPPGVRLVQVGQQRHGRGRLGQRHDALDPAVGVVRRGVVVEAVAVVVVVCHGVQLG